MKPNDPTLNTGGFFTFQGRLHPSNAAGTGDTGSSLIEALIAMTIVMVVSTAFAAGMVGAIRTQKTAQVNDISAQAANSVLEKARSVQWLRVGINTSDANRRTTWRSNGTVNASGTDFPAVSTVVIRNSSVAVRTDITWVEAPAATGFGSKRIEVTTTWKDGAGKTINNTFAYDRTSTPAEAVPDGVPGYVS